MLIANLTLHPASPEMLEWLGLRTRPATLEEYTSAGLDKEHAAPIADPWQITEPLGREVPSWASPLQIAEAAVEIVQAGTRHNCDAVLVGGLTDLTYYEIHECLRCGLMVFVARTRRTHDENGRFVFSFDGVRQILPAKTLLCAVQAGMEE